jgi:hypothetical protein
MLGQLVVAATSLTLRLPPLPHQQRQFLAFQVGQQPQLGLDLVAGLLGHVHAVNLAWWLEGDCRAGLIAG